jgi:hypothetical protein
MVIIASIAALVSLNAGGAHQSSALLRYKFKSGESHVYSMGMNVAMTMNMTAKGSPTPMKMGTRTTMTMSVDSVLPDGSAKMSVSVAPTTMTMNGKNMPAGGQSQPTTGSYTMSPTGKMHGMNMSGSAGASGPMGIDTSSIAINYAFPTGPVHVGSTWVSPVSLPSFGSIPIHDRLVAFKTIGGDSVAVVRGTGSADLGELIRKMSKQKAPAMRGMMKMSFIYYFNVTKGLMDRSDMDADYMIDMSMPSQGGAGSGAPMNMSGKMTMSMSKLR